MNEASFEPISWSAPEYSHKPRTADFFWTIGIITILGCIAALWFANYVFAIFIFIAGGCLILFTIREPELIRFTITSEGFAIGKENHPWARVRGYTIIKDDPYNKLLIETARYFLPIYNIPLPHELTKEVDESLHLVVPNVELQESHSMLFAEKIGF